MRRTAIVFFIIVLCLSASNAQASMTLNDGLPHDISVPISGNLYVEDNPSPPPLTTTVNIHTGALIDYGWGLLARDSSLVNIYGGSIDVLAAEDSSLVNIYGGSIGQAIITIESSTVNIYGGSVPALEALGSSSSTVNIYGVGFNYPYGLIPITVISDTLIGTLHMGDSLSMDFNNAYGQSIILHEMAVVPAPGAALLGTLGLISASWRLRKRRTV